LIHKKKFAEIGLWILMGTTVSMSYLARYDNFGVIDYSKLIVEQDRRIPKDKKVLALDENWGVYKNNALASPFLDWRLSKEIFKGPDYYENVIKVYQGLTNDPPDVIRDKENLLKPFLERIPELKRQYVREGIYYNKRSASN
jgi:hypothetical protein